MKTLKQKNLVDLHIHTDFSHDGKEPMENYVKKALLLGHTAIGFSDHFDYDCYLLGKTDMIFNIGAYMDEITRLRDKYAGRIEILAGAEFGYSREAVPIYREIGRRYTFDYIINSTHVVEGEDCCFNKYCSGKSKTEAYRKYLELLKESLDADYPFEIVGHIGYPSRYAPFDDKIMTYSEFAPEFDVILKKIIEKGKYLELNTSTKSNLPFLPGEDVADAYIALGGDKFTFGSDAHEGKRYYDGAKKVEEYLFAHGEKANFFRSRHAVTVD